jgi:purine nucleosidase
MAEVWFRGREHLVLHDPLAAAVLFEPTLCGYAEGQASVAIHEQSLAGLTRFAPMTEAPPHRVATTVEAERFFEHYFGVVGG